MITDIFECVLFGFQGMIGPKVSRSDGSSGQYLNSLVTIAEWSHPVPSRTRKLSTLTANVAQARLARCQAAASLRGGFFLGQGSRYIVR